MILFLEKDRLFPVGNLCFQFKGNYFDMGFVSAFWTHTRESLLRFGKGYSFGNLCFLFRGNYSREGFLVLGWRDNSSVCVEGRVKDGNGR